MPRSERVDDPWNIDEGEWVFDGTDWWVRPPEWPFAAKLVHEVVEHDDGTITVSPSILHILGNGNRWHGYLVRGEWKKLPDSTV
jgi:hypothetical protein